jgi:hypothetical protein
MNFSLKEPIVKLSHIFESVRIVGVAIAIFLGYYLLGKQSSQLSLTVFMPTYVLTLIGLTGIQLVFSPVSGCENIGRPPNKLYQLQSGLNCLALSIMAIVVTVFSWGKFSQLTLVLTSMIFILLSTCVHTWEIFALRNRAPVNIFRPIGSLAMCASVIPLLIIYFK